jgi:hypothetical protein
LVLYDKGMSNYIPLLFINQTLALAAVFITQTEWSVL